MKKTELKILGDNFADKIIEEIGIQNYSRNAVRQKLKFSMIFFIVILTCGFIIYSLIPLLKSAAFEISYENVSLFVQLIFTILFLFHLENVVRTFWMYKITEKKMQG
jgi:hypothetical protein